MLKDGMISSCSFDSTFGEMLSELMSSSGTSCRSASIRMGGLVDRTTIGRWLSGHSHPSVTELDVFFDMIGVGECDRIMLSHSLLKDKGSESDIAGTVPAGYLLTNTR